MKDFIPLIQTLLWVGLIGYIVWRFNNVIDSILRSLCKRIEQGSGLKAGPFELSEILKPADAEQQKQKIDTEISQSLETENLKENKPKADQEKRSLRSLYFQAEDLALRELQSEYGQSISRQLRTGSGFELDGIFVKNGKAHIIEVKIVRRSVPATMFHQVVHRIFTHMIEFYHWTNIQLIFVAIYEDDHVNLELEKNKLKALPTQYIDKIEIKCYKLSDLQNKFGMTAS